MSPMERFILRDPLNALNSALDYAHSRSPFYRERLRKWKLSDISELAELPFTTPDELKSEALNMLAVPLSEIERITTLRTSGSTSAPKRVYFTERDLELTAEFFQYGMQCLVGADDTVFCLFPGETPGSVGELLARGLKRVPIGVVSSPEEATCIVGSPTQVLTIPQMPLRSVLLSSEHVFYETGQTIRGRYNCAVYEHYGLTESGFGFAVSCSPNIDFYHIRERDLYTEIIDPVTLQPLPDGKTGEIVFTTLTREGMPLVRYRTGDISSIRHGVCPLCGSATPTLSRVADRGIVKAVRTM